MVPAVKLNSLIVYNTSILAGLRILELSTPAFTLTNGKDHVREGRGTAYTWKCVFLDVVKRDIGNLKCSFLSRNTHFGVFVTPRISSMW